MENDWIQKLVDDGIVSPDQLADARELADKIGFSVEDALLKLEYVSVADIRPQMLASAENLSDDLNSLAQSIADCLSDPDASRLAQDICSRFGSFDSLAAAGRGIVVVAAGRTKAARSFWVSESNVDADMNTCSRGGIWCQDPCLTSCGTLRRNRTTKEPSRAN